jgi:alkanesulfonate monooxygenase SsuD/methylene tetrahydromethanopterin reductase-like flavin-dependent oxidoreductase (luciferase family)
MRYGFINPNGEPRFSAEIASLAEDFGWDGIFIADCIAIDAPGVRPDPTFDPWITLAAMALRTNHIRLGTMLTAVPRRRPWKLAKEIVTLDHLSEGRMIFAAGLGAAQDDAGFYRVGEPLDRQTRAKLLDEGLAILAGTMTGEPFTFHGQHFHIDNLTLLPVARQQPRVPIWVVGAYPSEQSMARVARYDGLLPALAGTTRPITPDDIRAMRAYLDERRPTGPSIDIIYEGRTSGEDPSAARAHIEPFAAAGVTWWLESLWFPPNDAEAIRTRVRQGPPR